MNLAKSVSSKDINVDQLQDLLGDLLAEGVIPDSAPLSTILRVHREYKNDPNREFITKVYDVDAGKVVDMPAPRFNFALDFVAILASKPELYFILDNTKIVCVYDYDGNAFTAEEVYMIISSMFDRYTFEIVMVETKDELETYIGVPLAT